MQNNALMDLAQAKEYEKLLGVYQQHPIESVAEAADF
jgi:hypothetical protein